MTSASLNGAPEFRPYIYRGTGEDTLTPWMDRQPVKRQGTGRKLQPCGTPAAAQRHHRHGEPLDELCLEAERLRIQYTQGGSGSRRNIRRRQRYRELRNAGKTPREANGCKEKAA